MTVTRFGSAQSFLFQRASTVSMLGIYSDQDSIPTPPFRLLPSTQRRDNLHLTATDRSGSAGKERSSVRFIALLGGIQFWSRCYTWLSSPLTARRKNPISSKQKNWVLGANSALRSLVRAVLLVFADIPPTNT